MSKNIIETYTTERDKRKLVDFIHYSRNRGRTTIIEGYVDDGKLINEKNFPWQIEQTAGVERLSLANYLDASIFLGDTVEEIIQTFKIAEAKHLLKR